MFRVRTPLVFCVALAFAGCRDGRAIQSDDARTKAAPAPAPALEASGSGSAAVTAVPPANSAVLAVAGSASATPAASVAPAAPPAPRATRRAGATGPLKVWTMGDSTAQPVGQALENIAHSDGRFKARTFFRNSSGLVNQNKADWYDIAKKELATGAPDILVVSLGPNDAMDLTSKDKKERYTLASDGWTHEYARRMVGFAKMFEDKGVRVYLSGHVFDPEKKHAPMMKAVDSALAEAGSALENGAFFDTFALFTNADGTFQEQAEGPDGKLAATRGHDKLHLTGAGGHAAAKALWAKIVDDFALPPPEKVEKKK
jgi:hypothetical protein